MHWLRRHSITVMFVIIMLGVVLIATRQQLSFNDHKRLDEKIEDKTCLILTLRWQSQISVIQALVDDPSMAYLGPARFKAAGPKPVCGDTK